MNYRLRLSGVNLRGLYTYDRACRIAHFVRELGHEECVVVSVYTTHPVKEHFEWNRVLDASARLVAEEITDNG